MGFEWALTKEVPVDVPVREFFWRELFALVLRGSNIYDEAVTPFSGLFMDPVLATHQLADGIPGLGCEIFRAGLLVVGHVGAFPSPGGFVVGVEAKAVPDILCPGISLLLCKAVLDADEAVLHEVIDLLWSEVFKRFLFEVLHCRFCPAASVNL